MADRSLFLERFLHLKVLVASWLKAVDLTLDLSA